MAGQGPVRCKPHAAISTEWDDAVAALGNRAHQQIRPANETNSLCACLAKKTDECAELRRRLEAAATVIATLHHENAALRANSTDRDLSRSVTTDQPG